MYYDVRHELIPLGGQVEHRSRTSTGLRCGPPAPHRGAEVSPQVGEVPLGGAQFGFGVAETGLFFLDALHHDWAVSDIDDLGWPVGDRVPGWSARRAPANQVLAGRWCRLEPLDPARHAEALHRAYSADESAGMWTYLPYGPFASGASYRDWVEQVAGHRDPLFFAVVEAAGNSAAGVLALQRIDVASGSAEVAHVTFSPALQRTTAATEAIFLVMSLLFDELGYRRFEWKCDSLNAPSKRAASRFGFVYEGTFRQAGVVKGRNRDTAWFSIIDSEWPARKAAFEAWLAPDNFDQDGKQRVALSRLVAPERS